MRFVRIWCTAALAVMLCVSASSEATQSERHEIPHFSNLLVTVSLEFSVTVCLADVEYSIACWERASSEAARRLEQIYLDDDTTGRAAGSLRDRFPLATEQSEQLRFLREAGGSCDEDRGSETARRGRTVAAHFRNESGGAVWSSAERDPSVPTAAEMARGCRP